MSEYRIYRISCPDGRAYIGCTKTSISQRVAGHLAEVRGYGRPHLNPNLIGFAIERYGRKSVVIEHIASAIGAQNAAEVETALIRQHGTLYPQGYNIRAISAVRRGVALGVGQSLSGRV